MPIRKFHFFTTLKFRDLLYKGFSLKYCSMLYRICLRLNERRNAGNDLEIKVCHVSVNHFALQVSHAKSPTTF